MDVISPTETADKTHFQTSLKTAYCDAGQLKPLREAFTISRQLEFFTEPELTKQIGHSRHLWPLVIVKELVDNSLDNCEERGILPEVQVDIDRTKIVVADNGTGLDSDTIEQMLDFTSRVSSREAYRSLSRGAMGNAGKCLIAIPFVASGGNGRVIIESQGIRHEIRMKVDHVAQLPTVEHHKTEGKVTSGTSISVLYACTEREYDERRFLLFADAYADLNPHLTLKMNCQQEGSFSRFRTSDKVTKWSPREPDPPAWYDLQSFERLLGACIKKDRDHGEDRPLREFVRTFAGLKGSANLKKVTADTESSRSNLSSLLNCEGFDRQKTGLLLQSMKEHGRAPRPERLGVIGRDHIAIGSRPYITGDIKYKKQNGFDTRGLPYVVEVAFAELADTDRDRILVTGCNFSPALDTSVMRMLDWTLSEQLVGRASPVYALIHVATIAPNYLDRGKSVLDPDREVAGAVADCVRSVTAEWYKRKKAEDRDALQQRRKAEKQKVSASSNNITLKDAVFRVLNDAVNTVSSNGGFEFSNRELLYIVRPLVQQYTDKELKQQNFDAIVDQYEKLNGLIDGRNRDPRGYLLEPHTHNQIPLGTKSVEEYEIPWHRYNRILYVEKKNILNKIGSLGDKYDMAIMAAEGYSARAGKALLQAAQNGHEMQVFCLHDADPHGYNISRTLSQSSGAHNFNIEVIDLGFSITEAVELGLPTENFVRKKAMPKGLQFSDEELTYFLGEEKYVRGRNGKTVREWHRCRRVELNALSAYPEKFIAWLEGKLQSHGATEKLVPPMKAIDSHARRKGLNLLREKIKDEILMRLRIEDKVQSVASDLTSQLDLSHIYGAVKDWSKNLNTSSWSTEVDFLASESVDQLNEKVVSLVGKALSEIGGVQ